MRRLIASRPDVLAGEIIEHLDVVENIRPCVVSGLVGSASNTFALEQVEEAFCNSIVMTVAPAAHAVFKIVLLQE